MTKLRICALYLVGAARGPLFVFRQFSLGFVIIPDWGGAVKVIRAYFADEFWLIFSSLIPFPGYWSTPIVWLSYCGLDSSVVTYYEPVCYL